MGCSVGKPTDETQQKEVISPSARKKYSTSIATGRVSGSMRFSTSGTHPAINANNHQQQSASEFQPQLQRQSTNGNRRSISISTTNNNFNKPVPALQVDYINDPAETDQITAKIVRQSPTRQHKKSIDQLGWSPSTTADTTKAKLQSPYLQSTRAPGGQGGINAIQKLTLGVGIVHEHSEVEEQSTRNTAARFTSAKKELPPLQLHKELQQQSNQIRLHAHQDPPNQIRSAEAQNNNNNNNNI